MAMKEGVNAPELSAVEASRLTVVTQAVIELVAAVPEEGDAPVV